MYKKIFTVWLALAPFYQYSTAQTAPTANVPDNTPVTPGNPITSFPYLVDYSNTANRNLVRTYIPQVATKNSGDVDLSVINSVLGLPAVPCVTATAYVDGLGRPMQEVVRMGNPSNARDIVTVHAYDNMDRESYRYLGYGAADYTQNRGKLRVIPLTELSGTYNISYPGEQPYGQTIYEKSPLERATKTMAPGSSWIGSNRGSIVDYNTNANGNEDRIIMYSIGYSGVDFNTGTFQDLPISAGNYPIGTLAAVKTTDEDGKWVVEYIDQLGRKIAVQRFADYSGTSAANWNTLYNITYYVYDDLNNLRFVVSPEAYRQAMQTGGTITQSIAKGLCYQYWYDNRGRMIAKRLPGKETEYMVYDTKDRIVLSQDGNMRASGKWSFVLYDMLSRPALTGVYTSTSTQAQLATQLADASTYAAPDLMYYMKQANLLNNAPATINNCELLAYTYYDDYSNTPVSNFNYSFNSKLTGLSPYASMPIASNQARGLVTGTKVKVMDPAANVQWLTATNFYDIKGQLIQQQANNIKNGTDIVTNQYDFAGTLVSSVLHHNNPQAAIINGVNYTDEEVIKRYTKNYQCGQITQLEQNINNVGWRSIYTLGYDDFNRLKNKNLSAADNFYDYNIRGMLTGINAGFIDASNPTNKYFFETLSYDQGFVSKLYNGNIAGITWKGAGGGNKRSYGYTYDGLNRLTHAEYNELVGSPAATWNKSQTDYTASNINYDYNGNIKTMHQRGPGSLNGGPVGMVDMDKLAYAYAPNSNQLVSVTESNTGVISNALDFKDGNTSGNDYDYDQNGNLKYDKNKAINANIAYSYLNKPAHIVLDGKGTIDYVYDGLGNKLQKKATPVSGSPVVTDYMGGFVYENDKLQYLLHEEGRCRPQLNNTVATTPVFDYDYFLKDHLGNVRSVINAQPAGIGPTLDYNAGMELSMANVECVMFRHLDDVRSDKPLSTSPTDTKAAELDGTDPNKRIGVSLMLKVMPGDRFELSAESYYDAVANEQSTTAEDIAASLFNTLAGGTTYTGVPVAELPENVRTIQNIVGGQEFASAYDALTNTNYDNTKPAAFLNYMVFDENFRPVSENSGALQTTGAGGQWNLLSTNGQITIGKPGYITVFASSKAGSPVYFDKVDLTYYKGTVLEENHYYPFGLTLSTQTPNANEKNNIKFQSQQLEDDFGLNVYSFKYREHDMQTGRFWQVDPLAEKYTYNSTYAFSENKVVNGVELEGLEYVHFSKFQYENNGWDYLKSVPNGFTNVANGLLDLTWNSGVSNVQSLRKGTWIADAGNEFHRDWQGISDYANYTVNYVKTTPLQKQLQDLGHDFTSPQALEMGVTFGVGLTLGKLEVPQVNIGFRAAASETPAVGFSPAQGEMAELSSLKPTHYLTRSKTQMQNLVDDIRLNGIQEPLQYVESNGSKYIVGGNHRYFAAQKLGFQQVPVQQVRLPFAGYQNTTDLILEGKMPGYWKHLK